MPPVVTFPPFNPSAPANLSGAANILIVQVDGVAEPAGSNALNIVSVGQLCAALAGQSKNDVVYQALSADMNNLVWVQYSRGLTCTLGDGLSLFIQTTLSYSDAQMAALFASAKEKTV